MSRQVRFWFRGEELAARGAGSCGSVVARSLARRLGAQVTLGLGEERGMFRAVFLEGDLMRQEEVRVLSEQAW